MVLVPPFSLAFWSCYLGGGISDLLDGFVARKWNQQSTAGAYLDSIADITFAIAIMIVMIRNVELLNWIWFSVIGIGLMRIIGYCIGFCKFHTFSSLHTYSNKVTGALVFASPILYALLGLNVTGICLCVVAFVSSLEELVITVMSKELHPDIKSLQSVTSQVVYKKN